MQGLHELPTGGAPFTPLLLKPSPFSRPWQSTDLLYVVPSAWVPIELTFPSWVEGAGFWAQGLLGDILFEGMVGKGRKLGGWGLREHLSAVETGGALLLLLAILPGHSTS